MLSFLIDQIPLWAYVVVAALIIGPLLFYFSPIIIAIWSALPNWFKDALYALGALAAAFIYGLNRGARDAKAQREKDNADAIQNRKQVDENISKLSQPDVDKRLDKWMRD